MEWGIRVADFWDLTPTEWFGIYAQKHDWNQERTKELEAQQQKAKTGIRGISKEKAVSLGERLRAAKYKERKAKRDGANA